MFGVQTNDSAMGTKNHHVMQLYKYLFEYFIDMLGIYLSYSRTKFVSS